MSKKKIDTLLIVCGLILVVLSIMTRFLNLPYNFSPLIAMTLLAAYFLRKHLGASLLLPLVVFFISDLILNNTVYKNFYADQSFVVFSDYMIWTYGSILLIVLIGKFLLKKLKFVNIIGASLAAAVTFFLVTNFGSWLSSPELYPRSFGGLLQSYGAAIPFFRSTLISSVLFSIILLGMYYVVESTAKKATIRA